MAGARVGTSGWSYREWVGSFYPAGTSAARMLSFYSRRFPTVEAHNTYRRLPTPTVLERWVDAVPPSFRFAPKAHLGITHRRDLEGIEERVGAFFEALAPLGPRMGPVLFSVPHQQPDPERLERLLAALPAPPRPLLAFELGPAWATVDILRRLERHDATLVLVENDGRPAPELDVGPFTYLRLRRTRYDRGQLDAWTERLNKVVRTGRDAYAYFRHDETAAGPRYARQVVNGLESQ